MISSDKITSAALPPKTKARGAISRPGSAFQPVVERDDVQRVEVLALVFVDALDLDVEHPVGVEVDAGLVGDVVGQPSLVSRLTARHRCWNDGSSA